MPNKTIFDILTLEAIYDHEVKRKRPNNRTLFELNENPEWDLEINKTTCGTYQYPCYKITFWRSAFLSSFDGYRFNLRLYMLFPYLFFSIHSSCTSHSRILTIQNSVSYGKPLGKGTVAAKVQCESPEDDALFNQLIGKYKINFDEGTGLYYINAYQKEKET